VGPLFIEIWTLSAFEHLAVEPDILRLVGMTVLNRPGFLYLETIPISWRGLMTLMCLNRLVFLYLAAFPIF
jgi:hypothetical protein